MVDFNPFILHLYEEAIVVPSCADVDSTALCTLCDAITDCVLDQGLEQETWHVNSIRLLID